MEMQCISTIHSPNLNWKGHALLYAKGNFRLFVAYSRALAKPLLHHHCSLDRPVLVTSIPFRYHPGTCHLIILSTSFDYISLKLQASQIKISHLSLPASASPFRLFLNSIKKSPPILSKPYRAASLSAVFTNHHDELSSLERHR